MFSSSLELESKIRALLNGGTKPLIIDFTEEILLPDISKKPITQLVASFREASYTNGSKHIGFEPKPESPLFYRTSILPFASCSSVYVHPDYNETLATHRPAKYVGVESLEADLKQLLTKDQKTLLLIRFDRHVFLPNFSIEPIKELSIYASILTLSETKNPPYKWKDYVCLFTKPNTKSFYYTKILPYRHCTEVLIKADLLPTVKITSSKKSGSKTLDLSPPKTALPDNQISLYEVLAKSKVKAKFRDADHCVVCGKPINRLTARYIHLLSNGNLVDSMSAPSAGLEFGYFPIGSECKRKVPENFSFTVDQIKAHVAQQKTESY